MEHFNGLSPVEAERLAILAEECGEVVQIIGKILRHGPMSCHPDGGPPNVALLETEVGHVLAAGHLLSQCGLIGIDRVNAHADIKIQKIGKYLHHGEPTEREEGR